MKTLCTAAIALAMGANLRADPSAARPELEAALDTVRAVGSEGAGNVEAAAAWKVLATTRVDDLPTLLAGLDGASPLAANWIRAAVDTAIDSASRDDHALPLTGLTELLLDTRHSPRARRLAFELLRQAEPAATARLLPGFLNDPSLELRREAIEGVVTEATVARTAGSAAGAAMLYRQALGFARDVDQIEAIAKNLRELGHSVDLANLFGFLRQWKVIGPFDNTGRAGFATPFPPEARVDLEGEYPGKTGPVRWTELVSTNEYGVVDVNRVYGELKEVTAYAYGEFVAADARPAELRLGCKNGWKVWFNGRFLFGRDEYHLGAEIDQYRLPVQLQVGRNTILVKLCQNEQVEDWTREWEFQLRLCDALGTPVRPAAAPDESSPATASTATRSQTQP